MMTEHIIQALAQTARNWLSPSSPWRSRALEQAPGATGFSPEMISEIVDRTFGALTEAAFEKLLACELDGRHDAHGPKLIAHFLAGNVPAPGINSICFGLLLQSHNIVKLSSHDPVFPRLFVESLRNVDATLAGCVSVMDWRRDDTGQTRSVLAKADAVIAYGDDKSVAAIRRQARPDATFLGYEHKVSFGVVGRVGQASSLSASADGQPSHPRLARAAADDVCVYDQQGCMSPHVFYVEDGAREFAAALAEEMAAYQRRIPRGRLSFEEAAAISRLRGAYEFRSASDNSVAVWADEGGMVIYEEEPMFTPSCLNRVVFVKPYRIFDEIVLATRHLAGHISTVGMSPMDDRGMAFGAHRICPIGEMQRPHLWEPHDGRPNLCGLIR